MLNPVSSLVTAFRAILFSGTIEYGWLCYSAVFAGAILYIGVKAFSKASRSFIDTI